MKATRETSRTSVVIGLLALALILFTFTLTGFAETPTVGISPSSAPSLQLPDSFTLTGSMTTARKGHTATLLLDGRVLVVGGNSGGVASAELYDPLSGTFSATGSLSRALGNHRATLLQDGRTLITGEGGHAELYNPATGTFTVTGSMIAARQNHTATLLLSGKVLITGSYGIAELYDSQTGTFTATGITPDSSIGAAALLLDGTVLRTGFLATEIYDSETGTFSVVGPPAIYDLVQDLAVTLLPDGSVLFTGGWNPFNTDTIAFRGTALYVPETGRFQPVNPMSVSRAFHTATLLPGGSVLIAGGFSGGYCCFPDNRSAEIYSPDGGIFAATGSMLYARSGHTATLLKNGRVLIAGGGDSSNAQASAELYTPTSEGSPFVINATLSAVSVRRGGSFAATFSGIDLTNETYFDVRFRMPGSQLDNVALNWQQGPTANHEVPSSMDVGNWTITGIRAHRDINDHSSGFSPLLARLTVTDSLFVINATLSPVSVRRGGSFAATLSGIDLTNETYFDVRFRMPDSQVDNVALNWQQGPTANHDVPSSTDVGTWTITGIRAHRDINDHSSGFSPVLAMWTVTDSDGSPFVTNANLNPTGIQRGGSFAATFSGIDLTNETYFDVRFRMPGSQVDNVALNWQQGPTARHNVPSSTAVGTWTITGIRAHRDINDHSSGFSPVLATFEVE